MIKFLDKRVFDVVQIAEGLLSRIKEVTLQIGGGCIMKKMLVVVVFAVAVALVCGVWADQASARFMRGWCGPVWCGPVFCVPYVCGPYWYGWCPPYPCPPKPCLKPKKAKPKKKMKK